MLYGGPLGTYLSGYYGPGSSKSASSAKSGSPSSFSASAGAVSAPGNSSIGASGSGIGLSRNRGNRYRVTPPTTYGSSGNSGVGAPSSLGTSSTLSPSNNWNSFYTPQTRRKYPDESTESPGSSRSARYKTSPATSQPPGGGSGATAGHYYGHRPSPTAGASVSVAPSSSFALGGGNTYSRAPLMPYPPTMSWKPRSRSLIQINRTVLPNQNGFLYHNPYYPQPMPESGNIDFKRLYEAEKQDNTELRVKIEDTQQELKDLKARVEEARKSHHPGDPEQRRIERRLSEGGGQMKVLEDLRADSEKLKAEHRALTRVISRLM